jgi:hypothetical protein
MAALRRSGPPAQVRAAAGRERVLAYAHDDGGGTVVATAVALHLPTAYGLPRLPWDLVVRAGWVTPVLELTAQPAPGAAARTVRVHLPDPGRLPLVVREQVTASVVADEHVLFPAGGAATLVARRTEAGQVRWSVLFDKGLDPGDPVLREQADRALATLRAQLGV